MTDLPDFEARRLALQAERDAAKTQRERNRLGQFATPTGLAMDILSYGVSLLPDADKVSFLDPAIGTGSFYSAFRRTVPTDRVAAAAGYEIDPHYGMAAADLWADTELQYHYGDFTKATPPKGGYNLLICNPPYVRHHHLSAEDKERLQQLSMRNCGYPIRGLAGLYCYFMGISHAWMADDGIAGWLIPSEFMDVNYGKAVKQYLLEGVTLLRIHRFDPNDVQFSDALVSSAVVWIKKTKPSPDHMVDFTFGGTLDNPSVSMKVSRQDLMAEPKWTRFPLAEVRVASTGPKISDFFQIKRGLATGDNGFFILTKDEIDRRGLPWQFFRPILPSPRYLKVSEIPADDAGNPVLDRELFLLDCGLPEDVIEAKFPALWDYLQSGCPDVSERYLCQHRSPWYVQENRPGSPFVCTYMGRGDKEKPFRFILNHSKATATNVYLMLYPKPQLAKALAENPGLHHQVWEALNSIGGKVMLGEGRVYGGGLHKLEPKELGNVPAEQIAALIGQSADLQAPPNQLSLFDERPLAAAVMA